MAENASVIYGVVRDSGGRPVPGARVYFMSGPVALPDIAALTGADGAFALTAPASGSYEVGCATDDDSTSVTVEVSGRDAQIEIRL